MNIEEYISSGILEAYVLGELNEQERLEVEKNLTQYAQLREELQAIEETQEKLLMGTAIKPRIQVKDTLFQKIDDNKGGKVIEFTPDIEEEVEETPNVWRYVAAASVIIAMVSSYLAFDYRNKWKSSETSLADVIAQNQRVAQDYNVVNQRLDKIEQDIKVIDNAAFTRVIMNGTDNAKTSIAYVYWNASSKEVYLSVQRMKELSKENQYQLWAIIDGKPVDAGVFDGNIAGLLKMKDIGNGAAAFAVTVEPRGGKASPTLETMQVVGNVKV